MRKLKMLFFTDTQQGQSLVEILVAVLILSMVSLAFVKFSIVSLQTVAYYNNQQEAFLLAKDEALAITNNDYGITNTFSPSATSHPVIVNNITYSIHAYQDITFSDLNDANLLKYTVKVTWPSESGTGTNAVQLYAYS